MPTHATARNCIATAALAGAMACNAQEPAAPGAVPAAAAFTLARDGTPGATLVVNAAPPRAVAFAVRKCGDVVAQPPAYK